VAGGRAAAGRSGIPAFRHSGIPQTFSDEDDSGLDPF
jgi:hypothetical protein